MSAATPPMTDRPTLRLATLAGTLVLSAATAAPAGEPATLSVDDLIAGMQKNVDNWMNRHSWMVHYLHTRTAKNPVPGARVLYAPNDLTNARKGVRLYSRERQESVILEPGAEPELSGEFRDAWVSWDGKISVEREAENVAILPEPGARAYQLSYFTAWLFLDVMSDMRVRSGHLKEIFGGEQATAGFWEALPRSVINHKAEFRVRPELESVEGAPCHVLERPGRDIIWIDAARGFVCRKRMYYQSPGSILFQVENKGFEEKAPGLWIPSRQDATSYNPDQSPPEYRGKVDATQSNVLKEARFDDLPDSFFEVPMPDRATVNDYIRGVMYEKQPPGHDPWRAAIETSKRDGSAVREPNRLEQALWVALGLGLLLLVYQLYAGHRRKSAAAGADA